MMEWIFWVYGIGISVLPFLIVFLWSFRGWSRCDGRRMGYRVTMVFFAVYLGCVFFLTSAGTFYDGLFYGWTPRMDQINLIPFSQDIDPVVYGLNVLMFLPFGLLVPLLFENQGGLFRIFFNSLGFTLLIELSQLLNNRRTDVDDVILNVLGGCLGYLIFWYIRRLLRGRLRPVSKTGWGVWSVVLLIFFLRFFLFNEFGLAMFLYGL